MTDGLDLILSLAKDAIDQQRGAVDELRTRTGTVLAASAIAGGFLGVALLDLQNLSPLFWAGLGGFVTTLALSLLVLLPWKNQWCFGPQIELLYDHYLDPDPDDDGRRALIKHMASWERQNDKMLERLYAVFTWSIVSLIGGLVFWIWELFARTSTT